MAFNDENVARRSPRRDSVIGAVGHEVDVSIATSWPSRLADPLRTRRSRAGGLLLALDDRRARASPWAGASGASGATRATGATSPPSPAAGGPGACGAVWCGTAARVDAWRSPSAPASRHRDAWRPCRRSPCWGGATPWPCMKDRQSGTPSLEPGAALEVLHAGGGCGGRSRAPPQFVGVRSRPRPRSVSLDGQVLLPTAIFDALGALPPAGSVDDLDGVPEQLGEGELMAIWDARVSAGGVGSACPSGRPL